MLVSSCHGGTALQNTAKCCFSLSSCCKTKLNLIDKSITLGWNFNSFHEVNQKLKVFFPLNNAVKRKTRGVAKSCTPRIRCVSHCPTLCSHVSLWRHCLFFYNNRSLIISDIVYLREQLNVVREKNKQKQTTKQTNKQTKKQKNKKQKKKKNKQKLQH